VGERVEGDGEVDGAGGGECADELECCFAGGGAGAAAQAFVADEDADGVVAGAGKSQLLGAFADAAPGLGGGLVVLVVGDDECVQAGVVAADGEAHAASVPNNLRRVGNGTVARDEQSLVTERHKPLFERASSL
jgi:hypothetical protein